MEHVLGEKADRIARIQKEIQTANKDSLHGRIAEV